MNFGGKLKYFKMQVLNEPVLFPLMPGVLLQMQYKRMQLQ